MEKQITITDLRAIYTKDYDTFGKMDPYLEFTVGKQFAKTEVANRGGKQPKWTANITLKYFDQTSIKIQSWEDDTTTRDYMGTGKIEIKQLKDKGDLEIKITEKDGAQSGTIYGKYTVKNMAVVPMLFVRNIKVKFNREMQTIMKAKPYFSVFTNGVADSTAPIQIPNNNHLQWNEKLRIKLKQGERISLNVFNKSGNDQKIFGYGAYPKEFKYLSGTKKFSINDMTNQPLGTLEFQFETLNLVTKQQSAKNTQAAKKQANEITQININTIKGKFEKDFSNLYFKICLGPNMMKTQKLAKGTKQFSIDVKQILYGQKTQNKIIFAAYQEQLVGGDTFHGSGQLLLDSLKQGENTITLASKRNSNHGTININISSKTLTYRQIKLYDIKINNKYSGDLIGDSDMYILGEIGGWKCRTIECLSGKQVAFKQELTMKFSQQKAMKLIIMDHDIDKDDALYTLDFNLQDFKQSGQMKVPLIPQQKKEDKSKHGQFFFKYKTVNNIYKQKKQEPKKQEPKKQEPKKQQQKKQQIKKQQKKDQQKKQEPKKQELKKQQPKKQEKIPSQKKIQQPEAQKKQQKLDPNAEKQLTITSLRGVYLKDFDTFGKMDVFMTITLDKQEQKTQTAHDQGKQPTWNETLTLKYYEDSNVEFKSYDEDVTSNQYMGKGVVETKNLKADGQLQVKLLSQKNQHIGTIYAKYTLKALPLVPLLIIKEIQCDFYKDTQFVLKTKPYFSANTSGCTVKTQHKQKGDSRKLTWNQKLRLKIKDGQRIFFNVEDKNDKNSKIFGYDSSTKQFKTLSGTKKFNIHDKNFQPLGTLQFSFETQNYVNKDQSAKNQQNNKKQAEQLTQINIENIKGNLNKQIYDLYFKILIGKNLIRTKPIDKAPKDFNLDVKEVINAQKTENKISFAAFDEQMTKDNFKGSGQLLLQNLNNGNNVVKLFDEDNKHIGDINVNIKSKNVPCKQITINNIKVDSKVSGDVIGDSEYYIVGKIGGATRRTQTSSGKTVTFRQPLNFKYSQQKQLTLDVMEEDVTKDDYAYQVKVNLDQLKEKGQMKLPLILEKYKDDSSKHGQISFSYQNKKAKPQQNKKQQPLAQKKQQQKKQQPKKQEPKKQIPKKEEPKKEQPKKEQEKKKPIINEKKLQQSLVKQQSLNKSNLDRSRNTIKLPQIVDPKNYGDKIFQKQSSSTLQKSIHVYSMPKANRFGHQPKYSGEPTYCYDSCFKPNNSKGVGFGFGKKRQFPDWMQRNMKQNPAPGSYFDHSNTAIQFRAKGPTFGLPYKYYEKVTIPKQKPLVSSSLRKSPQKIIQKNK